MSFFKKYRFLALLLAFLLVLGGCELPGIGWSGDEMPEELHILDYDREVMAVGDTLQLTTDAPASLVGELAWSSSGEAADVSANGLVTARSVGKVAVTVTLGALSDSVLIEVVAADIGNDNPDFYGDCDPAKSYAEAIARSERGELSGLDEVPGQAPVLSAVRPKAQNGALICNTSTRFADENTYVVVDYAGREVFRVYRGGAYITLEEIAAYIYAFGELPANYVSSKNTSPAGNKWGEYLRLNHSKFSGSTSKYPYEPVLPRISGCGGDLQYYEIDIGTTGTDCDPSYPIRTYNNGYSIVRGAARIVYARADINGNKVIDADEKFIFYTYNHYNDFQQYLNYYGGWGDIFGNITGGGTLSSKTDYNPTPYIPTAKEALPGTAKSAEVIACYYYIDPRIYLALAA